MALTATQSKSMYQFFALAFNAAPGVTYMNQLDAALNSGMSVTQVVEAFTAKAEFTSTYPNFLSNQAFATKFINSNVGSYASDAAKTAAIADVTAALNAGWSRGKAITQVFTNINGLSETDATWGTFVKVINNEVAYAQYYTETLLGGSEATPNLPALRAVIANVTPTTSITDAAIAAVLNPAPVPVAQTFTLTTGADNRTLGAGNDFFDGALTSTGAAVIGSSDTLNGAAGTDTLSATIANGSTVKPTLISVENLVLTAGGTTGSTFNASTSTGILSITDSLSPAGANLTVTNLASIPTLTLSSVADASAALSFTNAALAGAADSLSIVLDTYTDSGTSSTITLSNATAGGTNTIETIGILSQGSPNRVQQLTGGGATTINITGDQNLTIDTAFDTAVKTVNASAFTGILTMDLSSAGTTITGGSGADSITAGSGIDNISGGAGNDTFVFAANLASSDTVNGGDGTDRISVSVGTAVDSLFTNVTSVETLTMTSSGTSLTLGALAQAAGIVTINASTTADTISATAYTVGLTVNAGSVASLDSIATGSGNDVFVFQSVGMSQGQTLNGGAGTDTIRLDNGTFGTMTASLSLGEMTNIEQIVVFDADGVTAGGVAGTAQNINLTITGPGTTTGAAGVTSILVDASVITDASDALLVTNNYLTATNSVTFNMVGGAGNDSLAGGSGNDTLSGGAGADTLVGNSGNDVISGGAGNDTIIMDVNLTSADVINGETGTDVLSISAASAVADAQFTGVSNVETLAITANGGTITLGALAQAAGIVTINASTTADVISATAYTVGLTVNAGSVASLDSITTGTGNDVFVFQSVGMSLGQTLNGGAGTDTIRLDNGTFGTMTASLSLGQMTNIEQIVVFDADGVTAGGVAGTAQNINLTISGPGTTTGAAGVTSILVDASVITDASDALLVTNNYLTATNSVTFNMIGGAGNDSLAGGSGADTLSGGAGADTLVGNSGNDVITGGAGNDTIDVGDGNNTATGDDGNDSITGGAGNDNLSGGAGSDTFIMSTNLTYQDTISGGDGTDILTVSGTRTDVDFLAVTSIETLGAGGGSNNWTLGALAQAAGILTINASTTADTISATAYTVGLTVNAGSVASLDSITTGTGNDVFVFQSVGMSLGQTLNGGAGTDTIRLDNGTFGTMTASLSLGQMTNIEQIVVFDADGVTAGGAAGTNQDINLTISGPGTTTGAAGVTSILVDASVITDASDALLVTNNYLTATNSVTFNMIGGAGNDSLAGGSGADTLSGGAGADTLVGNSGNDVISGGAGNDLITGGIGMDSLTGGAGNDTFFIIGDTSYGGGTADSKLTCDTITDLAAGDIISFTSAGVATTTLSFTSTAITLGAAATFTDYLDVAAAGSSAALTVSWFQFGGNTYVVENVMSAATFVSGSDVVVAITGLVNLSGSNVTTSTATAINLTIA